MAKKKIEKLSDEPKIYPYSIVYVPVPHREHIRIKCDEFYIGFKPPSKKFLADAELKRLARLALEKELASTKEIVKDKDSSP